MKKIYQGQRWKKHQRRVQKRQLKKKRNWNLYVTKKNRGRYRPNQNLSKFENRSRDFPVQKGTESKYSIEAPSNFSLINNPEKMLSFFNDAEKFARKNKKVRINMSNINIMTPDSLLYFFSFIEYCRTVYNYFGYSGNFPRDQKCAELFAQSGLFGLLKIKGTKHIAEKDILKLQIGHDAATQIALEVREFAKSKIQGHEPKMKKIYGTIIDCMSNTKDHAYGPRTQHKKWYLMALYDKLNNKVNFVFLDNGEGIPSTVVKNFKEIVQKLLPFRALDNAKLIKSALEGQYKRTQTKEAHRGLGLPSIYEHFQNGSIENLTIISNYGYVNCNIDEKDLKQKFNGTLLSWDLT